MIRWFVFFILALFVIFVYRRRKRMKSRRPLSSIPAMPLTETSGIACGSRAWRAPPPSKWVHDPGRIRYVIFFLWGPQGSALGNSGPR